MNLTNIQKGVLDCYREDGKMHYREIARRVWGKCKNPRESVQQVREALLKRGLIRVDRLTETKTIVHREIVVTVLTKIE